MKCSNWWYEWHRCFSYHLLQVIRSTKVIDKNIIFSIPFRMESFEVKPNLQLDYSSEMWWNVQLRVVCLILRIFKKNITRVALEMLTIADKSKNVNENKFIYEQLMQTSYSDSLSASHICSISVSRGESPFSSTNCFALLMRFSKNWIRSEFGDFPKIVKPSFDTSRKLSAFAWIGPNPSIGFRLTDGFLKWMNFE